MSSGSVKHTPADPRLPFRSPRCRCAACGEYFQSGESTFLRHRIGDHATDTRTCRTPDEMRAIGMFQIGGYWQFGESAKRANMPVGTV